MWARVARFDGAPADIDDRIGRLRGAVDSGGLPPALAQAKLLLLLDRASGGMLGVTPVRARGCDAQRHEAMNAGPGNAGTKR